MHEYWVMFAMDQEKGMNIDEFRAGYMLADPNAGEE